MKFRSGFKYQLAETEVWLLDFKPKKDVVTKFCSLNTEGLLRLEEGFAWDGASGPVIDRPSNQAASAVHDALYRMMRKGLIDHHRWREADMEFAKVMRKCGAWSITIQADLAGLWLVQGRAALPENKAPVFCVPSGNTPL